MFGDTRSLEKKIAAQKAKMTKTAQEVGKYFVAPGDRVFVSKGWGYEDWIWNDEKYCGKKLFVKKGKKCSWHYHIKKDEVLYIDSGKVLLHFSEEDDMENACDIILSAGDAFHVLPGLRHQFKGLMDSMITEVSTQHFDEDSIRVEKGD